jgi:hypothetical protein
VGRAGAMHEAALVDGKRTRVLTWRSAYPPGRHYVWRRRMFSALLNMKS